jgi:hypothetical protein
MVGSICVLKPKPEPPHNTWQARITLSPQVSPAVKELLSRIGGNPAGAAAAAASTAMAPGGASAFSPGRAGSGYGQGVATGGVPSPPPPLSSASRGTLNIVNAALRDVNHTLQVEASRLHGACRARAPALCVV